MTPTATARKTRAVKATAAVVGTTVREPQQGTVHRLSPAHALAVPLAFTLGLALLGLIPKIRGNTALFWSFEGAASVLLAWALGLLATARRRDERTLAIEVVLRK